MTRDDLLAKMASRKTKLPNGKAARSAAIAALLRNRARIGPPRKP